MIDRRICGVFAMLAAAAVTSGASPALSQNLRVSYVSANGAAGGGNNCSRAEPCTSFTAAHGATLDGGTIVCLEPGNYGAVDITKSITIDCAGHTGTNNGSAGANIGNDTAAFFINVPGPRGKVTLRGLSSTVFRAVLVHSAAVVSIEGCVFDGGPQQAILDRRSTLQNRLYVKDTIIKNFSGSAIVAASAGPSMMVLDNVSMLNNGYGVAAARGNNVIVRNSTISGNSQAGAAADGGAQITLENSTISNNNVGVSGGTIRLLRNNISFNNQAVQGTATSLGGNAYTGNVTLGTSPTLAAGASGDVSN